MATVKVISALEQPILGVVRHATDWEECRELWAEIKRRERLGIGSNAIFPRRHIDWRR